MREISKIVIHCTASSDSLDIGVKEVTDWHKQKGWRTIGYHWLVRRNGKIEAGRSEREVGAHVKGHNKDSIGIVWVGINEIGERQQKSLLSKVRELMLKYDISLDNVYGHYELFSGKTCPNLNMDHLRAELIFTKEERYEENNAIPEQKHGRIQEDEHGFDISKFLHHIIKHWFGPR